MDDTLNFGPRFGSDECQWINEDGSSADDADVGFGAEINDGTVEIHIGNRYEAHSWCLPPDQVDSLIAFLSAHRGG